MCSPHSTHIQLAVALESKRMISDFRLYTRQAYFDLSEPQVCQLFLFTNNPTYGALMESREIGDSSVQWTSQDPTSHQLTGVCTQPMSTWTSREHQKARYLALALDDKCAHGAEEPEVPVPEQPEQPQMNHLLCGETPS